MVQDAQTVHTQPVNKQLIWTYQQGRYNDAAIKPKRGKEKNAIEQTF